MKTTINAEFLELNPRFVFRSNNGSLKVYEDVASYSEYSFAICEPKSDGTWDIEATDEYSGDVDSYQELADTFIDYESEEVDVIENAILQICPEYLTGVGVYEVIKENLKPLSNSEMLSLINSLIDELTEGEEQDFLFIDHRLSKQIDCVSFRGTDIYELIKHLKVIKENIEAGDLSERSNYGDLASSLYAILGSLTPTTWALKTNYKKAVSDRELIETQIKQLANAFYYIWEVAD